MHLTSFLAMLQPAVEGGSVESSLALPCPTHLGAVWRVQVPCGIEWNDCDISKLRP